MKMSIYFENSLTNIDNNYDYANAVHGDGIYLFENQALIMLALNGNVTITYYLVKEDIAVIEFLAEKDGKAFEAEIRERFPDMPRTSLWRLVRRLEGLELVEIKRIGLENQVQLKK